MSLIKHSHSRRAVTLVEVIFSIGVVLIGLVGVASILPLAGNRAQESMNMSAGAVGWRCGAERASVAEMDPRSMAGRFRNR